MSPIKSVPMDPTSFQFVTPQRAEHPYTVSEVNQGIARIIEAGNTLVWVEGEISNWRPASSGHCYFKMKDHDSQIAAVMWRSTVLQLDFDPEDGMAVLAIATIRVYQKGGSYQLDVHRMQPAGKGALHAAFERLKQKLDKEGLFDAAHKRPLPASISTLGVVTSKRGAALRDIIKVVSTRAPQTDIVIVDVSVQGDKAAGEIAAAIRDLNAHKHVDCIIVGRGGGSIEDLWAFNEEVVARAIYESEIPIISAVGHEIDFTIADFVADVRAPTPSAAAEIAVPDTRAALRFFGSLVERMRTTVERYFVDVAQRYRRATARRSMRLPLRIILDGQQGCDELRARFNRSLSLTTDSRFRRLAQACLRLQALSPLAVLSRGYSVVRTDDGTVVRRADQVEVGQVVGIRFAKGSAEASITALSSEPAEEAAAASSEQSDTLTF